jgi:serine/threonine protein kinase
MAPEQVRGDYFIPATGVWVIGAVLFDAATGELPFDAHDEDEDRYEQLERFAEGLRLQRTTASGIRFQVVLKNDLVYHDERLPERAAALSI